MVTRLIQSSQLKLLKKSKTSKGVYMELVHKQIGLIIRKHREKKGMTQLELANKLGYDSMQFVSLFERGLSKVPYKVIGKLVVILGVPEQKITTMLVKHYTIEVLKSIRSGKEWCKKPKLEAVSERAVHLAN